MYKNLAYFKDLHVIAKVISLVLGIFSICFIQNRFFLLLLAFSFFLIFRNRINFIITLFFFLVSFLFHPFFTGVKVFMIYAIGSLFFQSISFSEIRNFLEYFFYRKKQSQIIYGCLYGCYFCTLYKKFFQAFLMLRKEYGMRWNFSFLKSIISQSFLKARDEIRRFMVSYKYRFYNYSNHRTYVEKNGITSLDLKYISVVFILTSLIYLYWG